MKEIKKILSLIVTAVMLIGCVSAMAEDPAPTVDPYAPVFDLGEGTSETTEEDATVGTDVVMLVSEHQQRPWESKVVFHVHDDNGHVLENAEIYLTYQGETELMGITDERGLFTMFLLLNEEYGFSVQKFGYETATGKFTPVEATTDVYVTLRQRHRLEIHVVDGEDPVPGVTVIIDGVPGTTDKDGVVDATLPNGQYFVEVIVPETGRHIPMIVTVQGDTVVYVDISQPVDSGFLVYDRDYIPRDFDATTYDFDPNDMFQQENETDEEFAARQAEFSEKYPNMLGITARPESVDSVRVLGSEYTDDEYQYTRRSLMPTGALQREWMHEQYARVTFTDGTATVAFLLKNTISGDMAKVLAVMDVVSKPDWEENVDGLVKDEDKTGNYLTDNGIVKTGAIFDTEHLNLDVINEYEFQSVYDYQVAEDPGYTDECIILPDSLYDNAMFEYRVTPIAPDGLRQVITNAVEGKTPTDVTTALYLYGEDSTYERERRIASYGYLTTEEQVEMSKILVDDLLTEEEIAELVKANEEGQLSDELLDAIIEYAGLYKTYRVSAWVYVNGMKAEITRYLPSIAAGFIADENKVQTFEDEVKAEDETLAEGRPLYDATEERIAETYEVISENERGVHMNEEGYAPGVDTYTAPVKILDTYDDGSEKFRVMDKEFNRYNVNISKVDPSSPTYKTYHRYKTDVKIEKAQLPRLAIIYTEDNNTALHSLHIKHE